MTRPVAEFVRILMAIWFCPNIIEFSEGGAQRWRGQEDVIKLHRSKQRKQSLKRKSSFPLLASAQILERFMAEVQSATRLIRGFFRR
jgi:hypothetical protein